MVVVSAWARVHGSHEHEIAGIVHRTLYAADGDMAVLQGLTQYLERLALELRQFVCKEHTLMCQGDLARLRIGTATHKGRLADGVVRTAERPCGDERAMAHSVGTDRRNLKFACHAMYLCGFQTLLQGKRRQDARQALCHHALAAARRAYHYEIVSACRRNLYGTLHALLPFHIGKVEVEMRLAVIKILARVYLYQVKVMRRAEEDVKSTISSPYDNEGVAMERTRL